MEWKDRYEHERAAREAAEEMLGRLSAVLNAASVGGWEHEISSGRVWLSEAIFAIQGYSPQEAKADPNFPASFLSVSIDSPIAVHPDDLAEVRAVRRGLLEGQMGPLECEYRIRRKDGSWAWVALRCFLLRDEADEPVRWVGIRTDISGNRAAAERVRSTEFQLAQAQEQLFETKLQMLRNQLNPHFLFNSLSSVSTLILDGRQADAEKMVMLLSQFFRYTLTDEIYRSVSLKEEMEIQRKYLGIEKIRFQDLLQVEIDVPSSLDDVLVPSLILQPIIENSIKYAPPTVGRPLEISVTARQQGSSLELVVKDNGLGAKASNGTGLGLALTRRRLKSAYGRGGKLTAERRPDGYEVRIVIPIRPPLRASAKPRK
jgi:hypothetical protein